MSEVLTTEAEIKCSHQGTVQLGPGASRLSVNGKPVLLEADVNMKSVDAACTNKPPPQGRVPCTLVQSLTAGQATKLTVSGRPVLLRETNGLTNSQPAPGTLQVTEQQTKLTAI